jgi:dihydroxyacetone kinase
MYNPYYMGYVTNRQARRLDLRGVNVKKRQVINHPDDVVSEALEGMELCFPDLIEYAPLYGLVRRRTPARDKVGIIAGGGSGHEPLHSRVAVAPPTSGKSRAACSIPGPWPRR